ncbi:MAG: tetratricopeptide repeat protein [Acidobacteriota bacterium]
MNVRLRNFALLGAVLGVFGPVLVERPAVAAIDPFYRSLNSDGVQAYDRGDYPTAARWLQLACFGLLDEPKALGGCLTRLAVAQAQSGDGDGFRESFRRLTEVETGYSGYTQADLPPVVRKAFEAQAAARIPEEMLLASPAFARLRGEKDAAKVEALAPKARRGELQKRIAADPKNPIWRILLGRLEVTEGRPALALSAAQTALGLAPEESRAICLRGLAQARLGACAEALPDLSDCAETTQFATPAAARLGCLVERKSWAEARTFVAGLPQALLDDRELSRLVRQLPLDDAAVSAPLLSPSPSTAAAPPAAKPVPPATPPTLPSGRPSTSEPTAKERESFGKVRGFLGPEAPTRDLKRARELAKPIADAHPDWRDAQLLMAEAAYRNSRWVEAASYFRRAGDPGDDRPELLFYFAVSLFESGDRRGAATILRRSLPNLQPSPFVDEYTRKILREEGP